MTPCPALCLFWACKLRFSCLCGRNVTHRASSPAPEHVFLLTMPVLWTGYHMILQCLQRYVRIKTGQLVLPSLQAFSISLCEESFSFSALVLCNVDVSWTVLIPLCFTKAGLSSPVLFLFSLASLPLSLHPSHLLVNPILPLMTSAFLT